MNFKKFLLFGFMPFAFINADKKLEELNDTIRAGNFEKVEKLLNESKIDVNQPDERQKFPIYYAVLFGYFGNKYFKSNYLEIVQLLMRKGANPHLPNGANESTYEMAKKFQRKHEDIFNQFKHRMQGEILDPSDSKAKIMKLAWERDQELFKLLDLYKPILKYPQSALDKFKNRAYDWKYAALNVPIGASPLQIRAQYLKLIKIWDPEKYVGSISKDEVKEIFEMINQAGAYFGVK